MDDIKILSDLVGSYCTKKYPIGRDIYENKSLMSQGQTSTDLLSGKRLMEDDRLEFTENDPIGSMKGMAFGSRFMIVKIKTNQYESVYVWCRTCSNVVLKTFYCITVLGLKDNAKIEQELRYNSWFTEGKYFDIKQIYKDQLLPCKLVDKKWATAIINELCDLGLNVTFTDVNKSLRQKISQQFKAKK